jgi:hypothetical protein
MSTNQDRQINNLLTIIRRTRQVAIRHMKARGLSDVEIADELVLADAVLNEPIKHGALT